MIHKSNKDSYAMQPNCRNEQTLINRPNKFYCNNCITPCLDMEGFCDICNSIID